MSIYSLTFQNFFFRTKIYIKTCEPDQEGQKHYTDLFLEFVKNISAFKVFTFLCVKSGQRREVQYRTIEIRVDGMMVRQCDSSMIQCLTMKRCYIVPSLSLHCINIIAASHQRAIDFSAHALFEEHGGRITVKSSVVMISLSLIKNPACFD